MRKIRFIYLNLRPPNDQHIIHVLLRYENEDTKLTDSKLLVVCSVRKMREIIPYKNPNQFRKSNMVSGDEIDLESNQYDVRDMFITGNSLSSQGRKMNA